MIQYISTSIDHSIRCNFTDGAQKPGGNFIKKRCSTIWHRLTIVSAVLLAINGCSESGQIPRSTDDKSDNFPLTSQNLAGMGSSESSSLRYTGINLAGAEFGESSMPGVYGQDYIYPDASFIRLFTNEGFNTIRLPFRWERLQQSLFAELDTDELNRIREFVASANSNGATVLLDVHNYARYLNSYIGQPGTDVSADAFADFWRRLALAFKDNPNVIFGLMNEPAEVPMAAWVAGAQRAIDAIRLTGAQQLILVDGNRWSGAHSWYDDSDGEPSNAVAMLDLVDPGNNMAFDAHQYIDSDSSGTSGACASETEGAARLAVFTTWLQDNGKKGFIGEFGASNDPLCLQATENMLVHMEQNQDVYLGWTWWAAGPWWDNSFFVINPETGVGREQLEVLTRHLAGSIDDPVIDDDSDNDDDSYDDDSDNDDDSYDDDSDNDDDSYDDDSDNDDDSYDDDSDNDDDSYDDDSDNDDDSYDDDSDNDDDSYDDDSDNDDDSYDDDSDNDDDSYDDDSDNDDDSYDDDSDNDDDSYDDDSDNDDDSYDDDSDNDDDSYDDSDNDDDSYDDEQGFDGELTMLAPADGSTLNGSSAEFSWTDTGALEYILVIGSEPYGNEYFDSSAGTDTSLWVDDLPTDGSDIYVTLYHDYATGLEDIQMQYQASDGNQ